ncbi:putative NADPH-dependent methylglyoxal reductase GRE2 (putative) [Pseudozyma hubeiensis]|nr:putative NADPH-dependent methylglyoxal reductase GRE2 (putative) [Pseudozyma hubeiensis]
MAVELQTATVLVTGANGFVGSHIVSLLLTKGYIVHATVRRQEAANDLVATFVSDKLRVFVIPDLIAEDDLDEAIRGCEYVVHVAAPVPTKDAPAAISIDADVRRLERVMKAASCHGCKRMVLTSSMSTHLDVSAPILNESTWFTPDLATTKPFLQYMSSKTMTERRAWELSSSFNLPLTTVAPVYIGGPTIIKGHDPRSPATNQDLLRCMEDESRSKVPGWIDVRTVAHLHVLALETDGLDGRRTLACTHDRGIIKMDCSQMKALLAKEPSALIEYDRTKRDLLEQIHTFGSAHTSAVTV